MEKMQFGRLFTTSLLWGSAQGAFKSCLLQVQGMELSCLMANGDADHTPLQIHARTCNPSDFFCPSSLLLTSSWCICFHGVRFFGLLTKILVPEASLPSRLQQWANTFDCPEQKELASDHQGYFLPSALSSRRCVPLSTTENRDNFGPLEEHFNHLSSITLLNHQRLYRKFDNEVGLCLSKVGHKLSRRALREKKNSPMPVK